MRQRRMEMRQLQFFIGIPGGIYLSRSPSRWDRGERRRRHQSRQIVSKVRLSRLQEDLCQSVVAESHTKSHRGASVSVYQVFRIVLEEIGPERPSEGVHRTDFVRVDGRVWTETEFRLLRVQRRLLHEVSKPFCSYSVRSSEHVAAVSSKIIGRLIILNGRWKCRVKVIARARSSCRKPLDGSHDVQRTLHRDNNRFNGESCSRCRSNRRITCIKRFPVRRNYIASIGQIAGTSNFGFVPFAGFIYLYAS